MPTCSFILAFKSPSQCLITGKSCNGDSDRRYCILWSSIYPEKWSPLAKSYLSAFRRTDFINREQKELDKKAKEWDFSYG